MERRRRSAPRRPVSPRRLAGLIACAVVPVVLVAAACSSGSGSDSGSSDGSTSGTKSSATTSQPPPLAAARYARLPASCAAVSKATVTALVPKAKSAGGTEAKSSDIGTRGGCSWTGNGKDGYQYRWLSVTLQRFTSSTALGAADDQARKQYAEQLADVGNAPGFTTVPVTGVGDEAASVNGKATVSKVTSRNATVVTRTGNVVLIVEFNGAGLEGKKNPSAQAVQSGAQRAAKDAVAAVTAANA